MSMTHILAIRERLRLTQQQLGDAIGVSQTSIAKMESGQVDFLHPDAARKLVSFGRSRGLALTLDMVYGAEHLPAAAAKDESAAARP